MSRVVRRECLQRLVAPIHELNLIQVRRMNLDDRSHLAGPEAESREVVEDLKLQGEQAEMRAWVAELLTHATIYAVVIPNNAGHRPTLNNSQALERRLAGPDRHGGASPSARDQNGPRSSPCGRGVWGGAETILPN